MAIQESLQHAGFVIADVRTLDRKQGSFKQVMSSGAVKQDLIISTYKPDSQLEDGFCLKAGTEDGVWDFIRSDLRQLPVFVSKAGKGETLAEDSNYLLFDRMVAFHVERGVTVPVSAAELYAGLRQRFLERDGMYFLPEQVTEYDRKRLEVKEVEQYELFVSDEKSAIQWVRRHLSEHPMKYQELSAAPEKFESKRFCSDKRSHMPCTARHFCSSFFLKSAAMRTLKLHFPDDALPTLDTFLKQTKEARVFRRAQAVRDSRHRATPPNGLRHAPFYVFRPPQMGASLCPPRGPKPRPIAPAPDARPK